MNVRALRRLGAALVLGSLATSAIAEALGEHPAVIVAREWTTQGIDPNIFIVLPPAAVQFPSGPQTEKDQVTESQPGG